ncbi:MAG: hypothetical protein QXX81_08390 [Zestosphaera sp.]
MSRPGIAMEKAKKKVTAGAGMIYQALKTFFEYLVQAISVLLLPLTLAVAGVYKATAELFKGIASIVPDLRWKNVFNDLALKVESRYDRMVEAGKKGWWEWQSETLGGAFDIMTFPLTQIWSTIYEMMVSYFQPKKGMTYQDAKQNIEAFVTLLGDLNLVSAIFDIIGDVHLVGSKLPGTAISRFLRNISWTYGLGWLSWLGLSPLFQHAITMPMDKYYKETLQDNEPTREMISNAYEQGLITREEAKREFNKLGYDDRYAEWLLKNAEKKLTLTQVVNLWKKGRITREEAAARLRTLGYTERDIDLLLIAEEKSLSESQVRSLFKRGVITKEEALRRLIALGYSESDAELLLEPEVQTLSESQVRALYSRGVITQEEAFRRLKELGYSDSDATLLLLRDTKMLGEETLKTLVERSLMHPDEATEYLKKLGYRGEELLYKARELAVSITKDEMNSLLTQAENEYAVGYLTDDELASIYRAAGLKEDVVALRMWRAKLKLMDNVNEQLLKYYVELYEKGLIDERGLRDMLSGIIRNPELLEAIVDYQIAKRQKKVSVELTEKREVKLAKLQIKRENLMRQLDYLITVRKEEEEYYTAKLSILAAKLQAAPEPAKPSIAAEMEQVESKMVERLKYLDTKIEQVKANIAAVDLDIQALRKAR